jgi:hypothetical protein
MLSLSLINSNPFKFELNVFKHFIQITYDRWTLVILLLSNLPSSLPACTVIFLLLKPVTFTGVYKHTSLLRQGIYMLKVVL